MILGMSELPFPATLGAAEYASVAVLVLVVLGIGVAVSVLTHVLGPKRHGPIKDSIYESGVDLYSDARRRFNVRFYIVAILFLVFDVEIIFFYPWAMLYPRFNATAGTPEAAWAAESAAAGFGPGFFLASMGLFTLVLLVGFVYEWRKGVFKWD
jgi:NADH-quinone oxidoreductase subunit A